MDEFVLTAIKQQFGAALKMLEQAVQSCPDNLWNASLWDNNTPESKYSEFWFVAYHTLFWLDLYLSGSITDFSPPPPFTLSELDPAGLMPDRQYSRQELQNYVDFCREKLYSSINTLTEQKSQQVCEFTWGKTSYLELLLYNMRHVQEHSAQLNMMLGQIKHIYSNWVVKA